MFTPRRAWCLAAVLLLTAIPASGCDRVGRIIPGNGLVGRASSTPALLAPGSRPGGATAIPDAQLAQSIVVVQPAMTTDGKQQIARSGSGVIVDADQRLILTSYAVVLPFRADGSPAYTTILISTNRTPGGAPTPEFEADLVGADPVSGIAVLRVMRDVGASSLSPGRFNLPAVSLGDARTAAAGLAVRLFGHPGSSDGRLSPLAIRPTTIIGIRGAPGVTNRTWLKTDARLPAGVAGGGAFNPAGALIGILAQDRYLETAEVSQLLPLELAVPMLDRTKKETARYQAAIQMRTNIPGAAAPPPNDTMWVSAPVFGVNAIQSGTNRDLFDYGARFTSAPPALYYEYVLEGVPSGTIIEERWSLDNVPQDSLSSSYRWDGRGVGIQGDRMAVPGSQTITRGRWRLEIWAGGALRAQATAFVGVTPRDPKVTLAGSGSTATTDAKPQAPATATSTQALAFFDFTGAEGAQTIDWLVSYKNQRIYTSPVLRWDYGDAGRAWVGYAANGPLGSGKYEIELHIDGKVMAVLPIVVP